MFAILYLFKKQMKKKTKIFLLVYKKQFASPLHMFDLFEMCDELCLNHILGHKSLVLL